MTNLEIYLFAAPLVLAALAWLAYWWSLESIASIRAPAEMLSP